MFLTFYIKYSMKKGYYFMSKRDPVKTHRNKVITNMTDCLKRMETMIEPTLRRYNIKVSSFRAKIGSKHEDFMNITKTEIHSPENFVALYLDGMIKYIQQRGRSGACFELQQLLAHNPDLMQYTELFLKRTYLRNQDSLIRKRPGEEDSYIWIGQDNANYGIFITPRFNYLGKWENDISEIRHTKFNYWTIGHILDTGFVIPDCNKKLEFDSISQYLDFFCYVLVRNSGSNYELQIAEYYKNFVLKASDPLNIPLLIPEYRYGGLESKHKYRLDFTVINPYTLEKCGYEISPWSTHGKLQGIKNMKQYEVNNIAMENRKKELAKSKDFYKKYGIHITIYEDSDFTCMENIFSEISQNLTPEKRFIIQLCEAKERFIRFH